MKVSDAFPSNYLKATDFTDGPALLVMDRTEIETIGDDRKMILYFHGREKGLVCNKTNANTIADLYGDDTEAWHGREIVLFEAYVDFQGKSVPAVRVRAPKKKAAAAQPAARRQASEISENPADF
jgi:hypothetical protein